MGSRESPGAGGTGLADRQTVLVLVITFVGTLGTALPPALPGIADALGVPDGRVGLLITFFKVPSILVIPFAAGVADLYGRRTVLLPSIALFGVAGFGMYFPRSFRLLLALALLTGIGAAAIFPITVTVLGDLYEGARNSAAQGLRVGVVGVGAVSVPAATGYLSGLSWNYPFLLFGLALPALALSYAFLEESRPGRASNGRLRAVMRRYGDALRRELADPNLDLLVLGGFVRGFVRFAVLTFVPLFAVRALGASLFQGGAILSVRGLGYVLVSPLAGRVVARLDRKRGLVGALSVCALSLVTIPFAPDLRALVGLVFLYAVGDALFDPVTKDAVTAMARPDYRAGVVNALYVAKRTAQTISPAAFGFVLALAGFDALFVLAGLVVAVYLCVFWLSFTFAPASAGERARPRG